jgi:uncharacterized protein (DUF2225 family)
VWTSTTYSKAVLRAVAGDVTKDLDYVDYFPSYEIITCPQVQGRYFEDDLREVKDIGVRHVMKVFERHYLEGSRQKKEKSDGLAVQHSMSKSTDVSNIICDEDLLDQHE